MAEDNKTPYNYSGNSHKDREKDDPTARKPIEKVISGEVRERKKTLGRRMYEMFFAGDDASSVGQYLLFDVIIPSAKSLVLDVLNQGLERKFYGSSSSSTRRPSSALGIGRTNYGKMYSGKDASSEKKDGKRDLSQKDRANHKFDEIVIDSRDEAETVLSELLDRIDEYTVTTVADFYDMVGITGDFTDEKWGWDNLRGASIRRVRDGYVIEFPRPSYLD